MNAWIPGRGYLPAAYTRPLGQLPLARREERTMSDPRIIGAMQGALRELVAMRKAAERTALAMEAINDRLAEDDREESDQTAS